MRYLATTAAAAALTLGALLGTTTATATAAQTDDWITPQQCEAGGGQVVPNVGSGMMYCYGSTYQGWPVSQW
jgi:hypothetical protein